MIKHLGYDADGKWIVRDTCTNNVWYDPYWEEIVSDLYGFENEEVDDDE